MNQFPADHDLVGAFYKSRRTLASFPSSSSRVWEANGTLQRELLRWGCSMTTKATAEAKGMLEYMQSPAATGRRSSGRPKADLYDVHSRLKFFAVMPDDSPGARAMLEYSGGEGHHHRHRRCVALWVVSRAMVVKRLRRGEAPDRQRVPTAGEELTFDVPMHSQLMATAKASPLHGLVLEAGRVEAVRFASNPERAVSCVVVSFDEVEEAEEEQHNDGS
tara:strand:+ start:1296 stop:1952 length:657 start_codon:yes stop_codon:yes gene_type:complete